MARKASTRSNKTTKTAKTKKVGEEVLTEQVVQTEQESQPIQEKEEQKPVEQPAPAAEPQEPEESAETPETQESEPQPTEQPQEQQEPEKEPKKEAAQKQQNHLPEGTYDVPKEETTLMMNFVGINLIPQFNPNDIWVRAVAKVQKRDSSMSWCVLHRQTHDKYSVHKIFGKCSPIHRIGKIQPIETIPANVLAGILARGRKYSEQTVNANAGRALDLSALSDEELTDKVIDVLINEYWQNNGKERK